jgi:phosphopantothenoylcysteine synthetase/decarboxylase
MKILVTSGNTQVPIDQVRMITSIFTGRTGTRIAWECFQRNHEVTLLTSHPDLIPEITKQPVFSEKAWQVHAYRTFAELEALLEQEITRQPFDVIIHVAAVSDFYCAGTFTINPDTTFDPQTASWKSQSAPIPMVNIQSGKIPSDYPEVWLRLLPTPKLIDLFRSRWQFRGLLIKFKLEVGKSDSELQAAAMESRIKSGADLIVANTLEDKDDCALIGDRENQFICVDRKDLARFLIDRVEAYGIN